MKKILVTGAFGQIGSELVPALKEKFGQDNVIAVGNRNIPEGFKGLVEKLRMPDRDGLESLIKKHNIGTIYHLVSLLSATGEEKPGFTWDLNMQSLKDVLDLSVENKIKVFWPSSIAAFGPTTPRVETPQRTILEPTTMYGVTKVAGELLCQYYFNKFNLDVRSVRYPGIISYKTPPGGGTTDYAVAIFYEALKTGKYECFVKEDTVLPMMYMDDAVKGTIDLMEADPDKLTIRTSYNLAAISFTVTQLAEAINKKVKVEVTYKPDNRQAIADSWPKSIDDSTAREDWDWQHDYDLDRMVTVMLTELKKKFEGEN
ncbi:MAG: NAD-dependent epimerase/dehydratase family protein [Candidatus Pacebacteria bacterium]|nr:NAD-dependent epimerase/dehydratase family protein [Candidatus Paceibacterota bacterium]